MRLGYFTDHAYERLLADVEKNSDLYVGEFGWLENYFAGSGDYYRLSSVNVMDIKPYQISSGSLTNDQKVSEDLTNVRLVHDAMKNLTPWQASNRYMWTYLCHANQRCWEYIQHRWLDADRENTIKTRFFAMTPGSLLNDNAISRLWWYGHFTYDESFSDPYMMTGILLTNETVCSDVIDTLNRTSPNRIQGVLLAIEEFKEETGSIKGLSNYVRECNRYLNRYAAVTVLEYLSREEIKDIALGFLRDSIKAKMTRS